RKNGAGSHRIVFDGERGAANADSRPRNGTLAAEHRPVKYSLSSRPFVVENDEPVSHVSGSLQKATFFVKPTVSASSDTLVNQPGEERRGYDELTPLGVERRGRFGGSRLIERATLLLEGRPTIGSSNI